MIKEIVSLFPSKKMMKNLIEIEMKENARKKNQPKFLFHLIKHNFAYCIFDKKKR